MKAAEAFADSDLHALGALMAQSHAAIRDMFEITVPPVDQLAEITRELIEQRAVVRAVRR